MARNFVPPGGYGLYERRQALGNPAKHKEGALNGEFIKDIENPQGIIINPEGIGIPLTTGDNGLKGSDLEEIFHVYGQGVHHRCHPTAHYLRPGLGQRYSATPL
jgi:hypothetical protein